MNRLFSEKKFVVLLDKVLPSSYTMSSVHSNHFVTCNCLAAICDANFDWEF